MARAQNDKRVYTASCCVFQHEQKMGVEILYIGVDGCHLKSEMLLKVVIQRLDELSLWALSKVSASVIPLDYVLLWAFFL